MSASHLRATRGRHWLCYVTPALTLYMRDAPTQVVARTVIDAYRMVCPVDRLLFGTGTMAPAFTPLHATQGPNLIDEHLVSFDRRRDRGIVLWDGQLRESWSLTIQGIPPDHGRPRASFVHVYCPNDVDPDALVELALALADRVPIISGHGGYAAVFNAELKNAAFDQVYAWAKRYPGLEVEDLNVTVAHVLEGIKGANWLTMLGTELAERFVHHRSAAELPPPIEVLPGRHGLVLRAGPKPMLGDRNRGDWLAPYAIVERSLAPFKIATHGEFTGRFGEECATSAWLHRFSHSGLW